MAQYESELADLETRSDTITTKWKAEKDKLGHAAEIKTKLDNARNELAQAQRKGEYQRAGELAYPIRNGIPIMLPEEARQLEG